MLVSDTSTAAENIVDRDRYPTVSRFWKIICRDELTGDTNITAATRAAGAVFYASPWTMMPNPVTSTTPVFNIGDLIQDSTQILYINTIVADPTVGNVSKWVSVGSHVHDVDEYAEIWFDGDHTLDDKMLGTYLKQDGIAVSCITDPTICHEIQWIKDKHWTPILSEQGYVTGLHPLLKWFMYTEFRIRGIEAQ